MGGHTENVFEAEICQHMEEHGWWRSETSAGYDKDRALFPDDVIGWLEDTQPDELAKVVRPGAGGSRDQLLDRLVQVLETPMEAGGGTLGVLRNGFKHVSARFQMCQFQPDTTLNAVTTERYNKVRVRVMRQVRFSVADNRSIDLVLFINGLPVATLELKTDFTQSVQEAIDQYRRDRRPKHPATKQAEPLLTFGRGALVHFAVSNTEVWMTTRLEGNETQFIPFNLGRDGGAGNPLNPGGSPTSYLWERVLQRDSLLDVVGRFMHLQVARRHDPISGRTSTTSTLLFPRLHQWDVVRKLATAARLEGPGGRYLVQHSAGSGKTNSIAWTAHRLARLHDDANQKVFDSVIVVTDRSVLDAQLQDAIRQIDGSTGVVATIGRDEASRSGLGSKSGLLVQALGEGRLIIVVTIQTFPHALEAIRNTEGLRDRTFAIVADEAHSSQTGLTARQLRNALTSEQLAELEDGGEIDTEDVLVAEMTARATTPNISYFAFTATPKPKTLEVFGRPDADGTPRPFHLYTMKQAIEERFILDVLRGYHSFDTAFRIAQSAASGESDLPGRDGKELVDESAATRRLMEWVRLHPTNIAQKVQVIVEHFRTHVEDLLEGHAKAMVVTGSRKAAVRYKRAIDAYIAERGYDVRTLVAFSGEIRDDELGPDPFSESSMNPGLRGRDLRKAFATNDYRIMLVANKFQTGFDQPLLVAMYVDKRLSGVKAVQTLSRLNRTYRAPGGTVKDETFILDFVNDPGDIKVAFEPYYAEAFLETATDPNLVHDLATKLDQAGIYTEDEVRAATDAWIAQRGNNALKAALTPAQRRFKDRYVGALEAGDARTLEDLDLFRKDVGAFIRLYDFMSQIVDYGDVELESRSIYLRLLERLIRPETYTADIDTSDVHLIDVKQLDRGRTNISLDVGAGLRGTTASGSGRRREPRLVAFQEVIDRLNEIFSDSDFTASQKETFVDSLLCSLLEDRTLLAQAQANSASQFLESPDLEDAVIGAILSNRESYNKMSDRVFEAIGGASDLIELIGKLVHTHVESNSQSTIRERLRYLATLKDGWHDGEGLQITVQAIEAARAFIDLAEPIGNLKVYPTVEGGASVERQADHGRWVVELDPNATLTVAIARFGEAPRAFAVEDLEQAAASLRDFVDG